MSEDSGSAVPPAVPKADDQSGAEQTQNSLVNSQGKGTSDPGVEQTRARTGMVAVILGDVVIAVAAIFGIIYAARGTGGTSTDSSQIVAILSSAFTAIGTMTTAYFGIKSIANAAQSIAGPPTGNAGN
jgi:hypothetical protein